METVKLGKGGFSDKSIGWNRRSVMATYFLQFARQRTGGTGLCDQLISSEKDALWLDGGGDKIFLTSNQKEKNNKPVSKANKCKSRRNFLLKSCEYGSYTLNKSLETPANHNWLCQNSTFNFVKHRYGNAATDYGNVSSWTLIVS